MKNKNPFICRPDTTVTRNKSAERPIPAGSSSSVVVICHFIYRKTRSFRVEKEQLCVGKQVHYGDYTRNCYNAAVITWPELLLSRKWSGNECSHTPHVASISGTWYDLGLQLSYSRTHWTATICPANPWIPERSPNSSPPAAWYRFPACIEICGCGQAPPGRCKLMAETCTGTINFGRVNQEEMLVKCLAINGAGEAFL